MVLSRLAVIAICLLAPLHAAVTNCPIWVSLPSAVSLTVGGTGTLKITANVNASVTICVPSGATATPAALTGSGSVSLAAGTWLGLSALTVSMTEAGCTASHSIPFYVDPASRSSVSMGTTCSGSGGSTQLDPQSPPSTPSVFFRMRATECESGFATVREVCEDINECATANGGCSWLANCANTFGSRTCACKSGTSGNGLSCSGSAILGAGSGNWTPPASMTVKVLAVGGGGSGASHRGGGGGSGHVKFETVNVTVGVNVSYTVAAASSAAATNFGSVIANGGTNVTGIHGGSGGSGGGGAGTFAVGGGAGGANGANGGTIGGQGSGGTGAGAFSSSLANFPLVGPGVGGGGLGGGSGDNAAANPGGGAGGVTIPGHTVAGVGRQSNVPGGPHPNFGGQGGTGYGAGGGGGGYYNTPPTTYNGGGGAPGVIILEFTA